MCVCEAPLALSSLSFTCLMTGRHPGSEGRRVRRRKTDADCAASQHLFQTDNFTGNWTKANSWGFVLMCAFGAGSRVVTCSKRASN